MKETNESYLIISGNCKGVTKEDIFDKHTLKLHVIWKIYTKDVAKNLLYLITSCFLNDNLIT